MIRCYHVSLNWRKSCFILGGVLGRIVLSVSTKAKTSVLHTVVQEVSILQTEVCLIFD